MLLVYTHSISPRLKYVFKHIVSRILGVPVDFTSKVEDFIAHNSIKMSYTKQALGQEFFVRSHPILFEVGISDQEIMVQNWDDTKCFFSLGERSNIPFDIFAASFYLLSRYEEYQPHLKDEFGRFNPEDSLAVQNGFIRQPVIDIWAYKFREALQKKFPNYEFWERSYSVKPIVDVPMAFYFSQKGILRSFGGTINDIIHLKFKQLYNRYLVLFRFRKDPYDTFDWIVEKQKKLNFKILVFFLIGNYSTYDKNVSVNKKAFVSLIKSVADYCKVGLKASYMALDDLSLLKQEKTKMESIINTQLSMSRNSFSKLNLPHSYRNLLELEVNEDYTMGYINEPGFRAGSCTPFLFYDIDYEIQTPLLINSFNVMDFALLKHESMLDKTESLQAMIEEVKRVNGTFIPVFHNYSFDDSSRWEGFKELFTLILESVDET